jgi:hypothetical protein
VSEQPTTQHVCALSRIWPFCYSIGSIDTTYEANTSPLLVLGVLYFGCCPCDLHYCLPCCTLDSPSCAVLSTHMLFRVKPCL